MERKLIISIVNGIVRSGYDREENVLAGIALLLCRYNAESISTLYEDGSFDYESLFEEGEDAAEKIQKGVVPEQLQMLYDNFSIAAEVLYLHSLKSGFRPYSIQGSIKESASALLMFLLKPQANSTIYNPFAGDYYAPQHYPFLRFVSPDLNYSGIRFAQLIQVAKGLSNVNYYPFNPFLNPNEEEGEYERIYIPALPFGIRIAGYGRKIEETYILKLLDHLCPGGRMVFVLPAYSLSSDTYFELRKTLLERRILRNIVMLPPQAMYDQSNLPTVAFMVENSKNEDRFFYFNDCTKYPCETEEDIKAIIDGIYTKDYDYCKAIEYSAPFSTHNVQIFDPSASNNRVARPGFKYVKLGEILKPYSRTVMLDGSEMVAKLSGKDMHLNLPDYLIDIQDVEIYPAKGRYTRIDEPTFCFHSFTLNYVWCVGDSDYPVYCNSDIYTFQIKNDLITPEYICFVLGQEDIKADIKSRVAGATIPRISRNSFLDVAIPVPDRDRQDLIRQELEQFISAQKSMLVEAEKRSHIESIDDIREDIKDKVHLMSPYDSCVTAGLDKIRQLLEAGLPLTADTKVYKKLDISFLDFIHDLYSKSVSSAVILESMGGSIFDPAQKPLDSFTFLQEYITSLHRDSSLADISFELEPIDRPYALRITQKTLQFVLDTIIRNAVSHGFNYPFFGDKRVRFSIKGDVDAQMAILSIANNGNPVDSKFKESLYGEKGGMCGKYAHSGRGGYFVKRAMDYYGGSYRIDTSNEEWPFIINLYIPVSHE